MKNRIKNIFGSKAKRITAILLCVLFLFAVMRFFPKKHILSGYGFSQAVFSSNGSLLRLTTAPDGRYRLFTPLKNMPQSLKEGTLLYEDRFFYFHPGFNPAALIKGFHTSILKKERPVGASTITMQLARMLYGINSSDILGKLKQIAAALWIEMRYSKNDILEAYLNIAPYGYNIEGAGAAGLIYFSNRIENLTLPEVLSLCVIPQNPNLRKLAQSNASERANKMRKVLFKKWLKRYPADIDKESFFDMPLRIQKPSNLAFEAPHFVNRVLEKNKDLRIFTSLDLNLQRDTEDIIANYVRRNIRKGIDNAAVLLVNYKTMEVEAYAGSADFFNEEIEGQVNGCAAYRSPGSTLKPLIYALALDKGIIHPMSLLKDTPKHYGIYAPENADREFIGPIFAAQALTQSRNIPAIDLLLKINPDSFIDALKKAGVNNLKNADYYGSSLAIGGFEISAEKIAEIYAAFANGGVLENLKFVKSFNGAKARIVSPEAAFLTLQMLKGNKRPREEIQAAARSSIFDVYWKTGTSYSYRDAWTAGIFGNYVLVVWIGRFNNAGQTSFMSRSDAAPLFFEIAELAARTKNIAQNEGISDEGLNVSKVEICAVSGDLPTRCCAKTVSSYFIPKKSPITLCSVHRPVYIDKKNGLRTPYYDKEKTRAEVYEFWDSEIMSIFEAAGIPRRVPPRYAPDIELSGISSYGNPPDIILPTPNVVYTLRAGDFKNEMLPFKADTDSDASSIFWFLDNKYIGQSKSGTVLTANAGAGVYAVKAIDDLGRASVSKLTVKITGN
ncbi:MAG: penicillin-binding protein 1C [Endomicrobium sp.]|nr:penicillin-binding protein 1C [Endomicrobium sp.]